MYAVYRIAYTCVCARMYVCMYVGARLRICVYVITDVRMQDRVHLNNIW